MDTRQKIVIGLLLVAVACVFGYVGYEKGQPTMVESLASGFANGLSTWGPENAAAGQQKVNEIASQQRARSMPFYVLAFLAGAAGIVIMLLPDKKGIS
jgi:hypothetical protein